MIGRRPSAPLALPATAAAVLVVACAGLLVRDPPSALALACGTCLVVTLGLVVVERFRSDDWLNGASFLLVPVALGFGVRGASLLVGDSHLTYPAWAPIALRNDLAETALWTATIGALACYAGYLAGVQLAHRPAISRPRTFDPARVRIAVRVLIVIGVAGFLALIIRLGGVEYFRDLANARLDTSGLGVFKLASLGARFALLLWLATTPSPSRRKLLSGCAVVLLLTTGQRSAVFATLIPVLIVYHYRVRRLPARTVALVAVGAIVLALALITYRDHTRTTSAPSAGAGSSIFRSTLVSLDGLVLVQRATPADQPPNLGRTLVLVPEGWVPRSIWAGKPPWRSNVLAARYLQTAHGGVFLSGFGTMWAMGLLPGVVIGSLLVGAAVGWMYGRMRRFPSAAWVLVYAVGALGAARFMLAGDEISLFFASQALVAVVITIMLVSRPGPRTLSAQ